MANKKTVKCVCPYCEQDAERTCGLAVFPHRPDLWEVPFYLCRPCKAWVGCHPGTIKPLGSLANASLRMERSAAHRAFDPIWKEGWLTRPKAYKWLSIQLGTQKDKTHIAYFNDEQCRRVVEVCRAYSFPKKSIDVEQKQA